MMLSGVSVTVATRDAGLRPEVVRAWGPAVTADGSLLTLSVPAPPGSRTRSNLEANGEITVLCVAVDYRALQVKGRVVNLSEPTPEQLWLVEEHVQAFAANAQHFGHDLSQIRNFVQPVGHVAVTVSVREVYNQTPGRDAGMAL